MITNLSEVRALGEAKAAENVRFRRYVADHHQSMDLFQILAEDVQRHIDCTTCGNCCRHSVVAVNKSEIETIAGYLRCEPAEVQKEYTLPDPDAPARRVLRSTEAGCVFLDGNLCMIYEARPKTCRDFPHVTRGTRSLGGRFSSLCRWAHLCPIIYNALEAYKHAVGYRAAGHD